MRVFHEEWLRPGDIRRSVAEKFLILDVENGAVLVAYYIEVSDVLDADSSDARRALTVS